MKKTTLLKTKALSKNYGNKVALDNLNFELLNGESLALLGCNGAGKSSLLNIITGLRLSTKGDSKICGLSPNTLQAKSIFSFLPQSLSFPSTLKVKDILDCCLSKKQFQAFEADFKSLKLHLVYKRFCSHLSGGEQRKLGLFLCLAKNPKLLILDEPTANVDLVGKDEIYKILFKYLKDSEKSLIFSSHEMKEVEVLARRVLVLHKGRFVKQGSVEQVKSDFGHMLISFESETRNLEFENSSKSFSKGDQHFFYGPSSDALVKELHTKKISFKNLRIKEPDLEEVFLHLWNENKI